MLRKNQAAFNLKGELLPATHLIKHDIELTSPVIIKHAPRFCPQKLRPAVEEEINALQRLKLIYRCTHPHSTPIVMVKQGPSKHRMCADYRQVNANSANNYYPVASIDSTLFSIANSKIASCMDLKSGFNQILLTDRAKPITTISTHIGAFAYNRMPFGLKGASFTLGMCMDLALADVRDHTANYHDDVFTTSQDNTSHIHHLDETFQAIIKANLQFNAAKSKLFQKQLKVLGHTVGQGYIRADHNKTDDIVKMPPPTSRRAVRAFLGSTSFFRKFIKNYAQIARPLTALTSDKNPWKWTSEEQTAFEQLKINLCSGPILRAPSHDRPYYLITDSSGTCIGSWIAQRHHGVLHPINYYSRQLRPAERAWSLDALEGEAFAIFDSLRKFRPFLYGNRIIILSDNRALQWLFTKALYKSPRLTRWALAIQGYGADILHIPGKQNSIADMLSRYTALNDDPNKAWDIPNTTPTPSLAAKQKILESLKDKEEQHFLAAAELIVDGDPSEPGNITLVHYRQAADIKINDPAQQTVNSLRANTPEVELDEPSLWSQQQIKEAQRSDSLLKHIIKYIEEPSALNKQSLDPNIKDIDMYLLDVTGILFKKQLDPLVEATRGFEEVLVVPAKYQKYAIQAVHNAILAGHPGPERTLWSAKRKFYWRNMATHITNFVNTCQSCNLFKGRCHKKLPLRRYPIPDRPWQTVSVDLIGPLPQTTKHNKYILVCVDYLTRYTATAALPDKSSRGVAAALASICCKFGVPAHILSDNGLEFRCSVMKALSEQLGFKHHTIAVHHPSSQGLVERKNQTIMTVLRQLYHERPGDWDECLDMATHAVNCAFSKNIGETPHFLYYHTDPNIPIYQMAKPTTTTRQVDTIQDLTHRWQHIYKLVKAKLLEAADRQITDADRKAVLPKVDIEDRVFIKKFRNAKGDGKLTQKFLGPYRVIAQKSPSTFRLKCLATNKEVNIHLENMKIVKERLASLQDVPVARSPFAEPEIAEEGEEAVDSNIGQEEAHSLQPQPISKTADIHCTPHTRATTSHKYNTKGKQGPRQKCKNTKPDTDYAPPPQMREELANLPLKGTLNRKCSTVPALTWRWDSSESLSE